MATTSAQVQQLYVAYLGRAADKAGLDYWLDELNAEGATLTLNDLRSNFVNEQAEYADAYEGLTRTETVSKIYLNLFGRSADAAGLTYWTTGGGASVPADELLVAFINGASTADAKVVANKVLVAEVYTSAAGENYNLADAKEIISEVAGTTQSITDALTKLEDGSLAGIAIPSGVAALKAAAIADAAATADGEAKAEALVALNEKVIALAGTTYTAPAEIADTDNDDTISYDEALQAQVNAKALYAEISGGDSVAQLTLDASDAATALQSARSALTLTDADAVSHINTYNAAVTANAALAEINPDDIATVTGTLQGTIQATPANGTAFSAAASAYATANPSAAAITNATQLYTAIKEANAATLTQLDTAFNTGVFATGYASVKTLAVQDAAKAAAVEAQDDAEADLTPAYVTASENSAKAEKTLTDAKAADVLVKEAAALVEAHKVFTDAAIEANDSIPDYVVTAAAGAGTDANEVFHFNGSAATDDDFAINFGTKDAFYIGEGYTLNTAATYDATKGTLTGGNNSALEVFFIKDNGVVKAVIETEEFGSSTVATGSLAGSNTDQVSVITLTGVTDVAQVSFANGVITHV